VDVITAEADDVRRGNRRHRRFMATITPAAGFVGPMPALAIGVAAGPALLHGPDAKVKSAMMTLWTASAFTGWVDPRRYGRGIRFDGDQFRRGERPAVRETRGSFRPGGRGPADRSILVPR